MCGEDQCRICYDGPSEESLIVPCKCKGSLKFVHESCLKIWFSNSAYDGMCETCHHDYDHSVFVDGCALDFQWYREVYTKLNVEAPQGGFTSAWFAEFWDLMDTAMDRNICDRELLDLCHALHSSMKLRWRIMDPKFSLEELNGHSPNFWVENWEEAKIEYKVDVLTSAEFQEWKIHWDSRSPSQTMLLMAKWAIHVEEILQLKLLITPCMNEFEGDYTIMETVYCRQERLCGVDVAFDFDWEI